MKLTSDSIKTKPLGHLGLVAATISKLGIDEKIDRRLPLNIEKGGIVPHGKRVAAMILNGLGFVNSRLYMSPMFFHDKPVTSLLGDSISAEHLNDDSLGRCLDKIAAYGTTKLFSEIAFEIAHEQGLLNGGLHLDTTSLTLYGDYDDANENEPGPIPRLGHSKDHRPDLKQVILSMTQMGPAHIPVWMEGLHGNSSDKKSFHETVQKIESFYKDVKDAPKNLCFVVDSAFYNTEKLSALSSVKWITRVPATLKATKEYYLAPKESFDWKSMDDERYKIASCPSLIGDSSQRWVMISSKPAYEREHKTLCKKMLKAYDKLNKDIWHLGNQYFECQGDAEKGIKPLLKKLKYFDVQYKVIPDAYYDKKGRPKAGENPKGIRYRIEATISSNLIKIEQEKNRLGRFILATNVLDESELPDSEILNQYKSQTHVEAGFKFIKNNTFELSSVFLKSQKRIGALMMIMTLCLLVYNFAQYDLRRFLKNQNDVLPNQLGKPIKNPTMQWIFALLATISVVEIYEKDKIVQHIITNIQPLHKKIITFFGIHAKRIYDIPIELTSDQVELNQKNWLKWCGM